MLSNGEVMQLIQSLIWLLAGVGVFIVGMNFMSEALEKSAGDGMKKLLGKISNNRFSGVGIGAGVTAIIQSSSATSVMVIGLLIRVLMMPMQIKTVKQSENMKKVQPEIARIEKKYQNKTDNDSLMMKSQETMMVYKKYGINPVSSCLGAFIQLPLFFAFLEAINRVPAIFEGEFLGMNLGMTPTAGIAEQQYIYIVLIVLIILSTFLSFKNSMKSQNQTPEMEQQMKFMFIFMIIMISFASLSLPTAIALYWIVTNGFAVIQNVIIKKIMEKRI
jgi:YidC/Oxa1 family membrane protein insertase